MPFLHLLPTSTENCVNDSLSFSRPREVTDDGGSTRYLLAPKPAGSETLTTAISWTDVTVSSLPSITFFSSTKRNKTETGFFEIKFYTKRILRYTSCHLIHIVSTIITASIVSKLAMLTGTAGSTETGFFEIKFYTKRILRYTMSCYLIHIVSTIITASIVSKLAMLTGTAGSTETGFFEIKFYTKRILRYTMSCYLTRIVSTRITASVVRVNLRYTREQQVLPRRRYIPPNVVSHPSTKILIASRLT